MQILFFNRMLTDYILIHQANGPILNLAYEHLAYDHKIQNSDILQFYESLKHHQFLYTLNITDLGIISPHVEMVSVYVYFLPSYRFCIQ